MAGHSKWSTIKRKKEKTDSARAKVFTKIGREIAVAVKSGGADPAANNKLRDVIAKAKSLNVPNDNIDRLLKSSSDPGDYDDIQYEGYGPGGVAVIVQTLTDNRNRTAADMRHYFDKYGGNLGTLGCVSFMFGIKGVILIEDNAADEDAVMEAALEAGAEDFVHEDGLFEVYTTQAEFSQVRETLEQKFTLLSAQVEQVPDTYTVLEDEQQIKFMNLLLEKLEDDDDVQDVWHNWEEQE